MLLTSWQKQSNRTFSECFDRQSSNRKQSLRKCRCSGCLCSELLFQLNLCHILSFSLGFCFFLVFSSPTAIFHLASVPDPVVGDLSFCLSFTFVEALKPWVPNTYLSILLHLCVHFRTLSLPLNSCFLYTQDSLLVMATVRCWMPVTSLCKNWFYSTNQACSKIILWQFNGIEWTTYLKMHGLRGYSNSL